MSCGPLFSLSSLLRYLKQTKQQTPHFFLLNETILNLCGKIYHTGLNFLTLVLNNDNHWFPSTKESEVDKYESQWKQERLLP